MKNILKKILNKKKAVKITKVVKKVTKTKNTPRVSKVNKTAKKTKSKKILKPNKSKKTSIKKCITPYRFYFLVQSDGQAGPKKSENR